MSISKRKLSDGTTVYDVREYVGFTLDGKRGAERHVPHAPRREAGTGEAHSHARFASRAIGPLHILRLRGPVVAFHRLPRRINARHVREGAAPAAIILEHGHARHHAANGAAHGGWLRHKARGREGAGNSEDHPQPGDGRRPHTVKSRFRALRHAAAGVKARQRHRDRHLRGNGATPRGHQKLRTRGRAVSALRLALGLLAGLRPEERYGLDWTDVDLQGRTIHVRRAYLSVSPREGGHDLKRPKTELSERVAPMPRALANILGSFPEPHEGPVLTGAHRGAYLRQQQSAAGRHSCAGAARRGGTCHA